MKTNKTLTLEIEVTPQEIQELVLKYVAENHEEFKKINDKDAVIKSQAILSSNQPSDFNGYYVSITKYKKT